MLSCFTFDKNQTNNRPLEMTVQESIYYTLVSVQSLLQYIVYMTYTKFFCMYMTIAIKACNALQQTTSMRLNSIPYEITVIYVTYFQMRYYLMQYYN